jgi:hypothetical protein
MDYVITSIEERGLVSRRHRECLLTTGVDIDIDCGPTGVRGGDSVSFQGEVGPGMQKSCCTLAQGSTSQGSKGATRCPGRSHVYRFQIAAEASQ